MGKYLEIIEAAAIPTETAQAHEQTEDLREHFEERAGILEHDGGLPRPEAEIEAARITATYARNRGYLWASLRAVFAEYPVLLSQVSATRGTVDTLPFGVAKHAALNGGQVVRQGTFTGPREGMTAAMGRLGHPRTLSPSRGLVSSIRGGNRDDVRWREGYNRRL